MTFFVRHSSCFFPPFQVPRLFVDREYVGGEIDIPRLEESGELRKILSTAGAFHES